MNKPTILEEYILQKIEKFTLVVLVQGYMQMGKSTFVYFLLNNLSIRKFGKPWNYKKYCARNLKEFIDLIDKNNNKLLVYEEASKDINISRWYNDLNLFFNVIMQTQAYKHNLVVLVFPHSASISKQQKYFINLGIEIVRRIDNIKCQAVVIKPTIYRRNFWKLDDNDLKYKWWGMSFVKYHKEDLDGSKKYTEWLEATLKKDVMTDIKRRLKRQIKKDEFQEHEYIIKKPQKPLKIRDDSILSLS